jgi:hypothetical protein
MRASCRSGDGPVTCRPPHTARAEAIGGVLDEISELRATVADLALLAGSRKQCPNAPLYLAWLVGPPH